MRLFFPVFVCVLVTFVLSTKVSNAAVIENLYSASVPIEDQSARQRKAAAKQALKVVLSKVSGSRELLTDSTIKQSIAQAEDLLLSYQFDIQAEGVFYQAEFDSNKVEQLIRTSGFPIWGQHRPETLIWLAVEEQDSKSRSLIADSGGSTLIDAAKQQAQSRGIKINFPVLDLIDLQQVSAYDVWASYTQNLILASDRYRSDYVMSAALYFRSSRQTEDNPQSQSNVSQDENVWVAEWLLTRQNVFESGEVTGQTKEQAIALLVDTLADILANKYAISAAPDAQRDNANLVQIGNISSLTAYSQVIDFLRSLSMVIDVSLIEQKGDLATFEVQLFGVRQNLDDAFRLDDRLQKPLDSFGQVQAEKPFEWRP